MRGSWFAALLAGVFAFAISHGTPHAATVFNDFGPGNSFDTGVGWTVAGASSDQGFFSAAMSFNSLIEADVTRIDLAIQNVTGPNSGTTISLYTNVSDALGSLLGSWTLGSLPPFSGAQGITTISGITGVHVTTGSSYFLLAVASEFDWNAWSFNDQSVTGVVLLSANGVNAGATLSAFDILGEPTATPLPAALPLFAGGLGMIGLLARRRKQKQVV